MVGDGTCDEACNVEDCSYDLTDCCSCTDEELGQCKTECLNASCAYDAGCDDDFMRDSAKYQQLIKQDFSAQLDFEECYNADSTCTLDDLRAFYAGSGEDLDKCQPLECFSQYGQGKCCPDEMHCTKCIGERCLECEEGYINYYTTCVETCPLSSTTQSKVPGICFRKRYSAYTDESKMGSYNTEVVGSLNIYNNLNKYSLVEALANSWKAYTILFIVDPVVEFSPMSEDVRTRTSSVSIYSALQKTISLSRKHVIIDSNYCEFYPAQGCLEDRAEIRVTDRLMTFVVEGFWLSFYSVKINGYYAFKKTCADVTCSYCPYLAMDNGSYFDDRHHKYDEKPDWIECEDSETPFIKVDCQGYLELDGIRLSNFRLKQSAFIQAAGAMYIVGTHIDNVSSSASGGGFIVQDCRNCPKCSLWFADSSVKYFNNGYEIRDELEQSSFLTVNSPPSVWFSGVVFTRSIVHSSTDQPLLSFIDPIGPLNIKSCDFSYIAVSGALISIAYSKLATQELKLDDANFSLESTTTQLELSSVSIVNVTAEVLVDVFMEDKLVKHISFYRLTISNSIATHSLVDLAYFGLPTDFDINGGTATTTIDGVKKAYYVRKTSCSYKEISITSSYWSDYAFKSRNLVNEDLSSVTVVNSGMYTGDLRDFTYNALVEDAASTSACCQS
jgi:hypothetical protein